jgi:ATP-dependent Lon protease
MLDPKYQAFVDAALSLPLGVVKPLSDRPALEIAETALAHMDTAVYGHSAAKEALIESLSAFVRNPAFGHANIFGLVGEPGIGKTSLIRSGMAHALDMPFSDEYLSASIPLDLSKCLVFVGYNDAEALSKPLRDRITEIRLHSFEPTEQVKIAQSYILPTVLDSLSWSARDVVLEPDALAHMCRRYTANEQGGLRPMRKLLQRLMLRVNVLLSTRDPKLLGLGEDFAIGLPFRISVDTVDALLCGCAGAAELSAASTLYI